MTEIMEANEPIKTASSEAPATEPSGQGGVWHGDEYAELVKAKGWSGADAALKSYSELEKFKGAGDHLLIPKDDDVDGWSKVYNMMGRPETADKYQFTNETGVEISDELFNGFKAFAHKEGYSQKQMAGAIEFQLEAVKASEDMFTQQRKERSDGHIEAMRQKWQNEYEPTVTKIEATAEKLGVKAFLEEMGISKEPEIVNMLLTIANSDSEDNLNAGGSPAPVAKGLSEQLKDIMASDAFNNKFHQDHKKVMAEYMELNHQIANSGQGRAPRD